METKGQLLSGTPLYFYLCSRQRAQRPEIAVAELQIGKAELSWPVKTKLVSATVRNSFTTEFYLGGHGIAKRMLDHQQCLGKSTDEHMRVLLALLIDFGKRRKEDTQTLSNLILHENAEKVRCGHIPQEHRRYIPKPVILQSWKAWWKIWPLHGLNGICAPNYCLSQK